MKILSLNGVWELRVLPIEEPQCEQAAQAAEIAGRAAAEKPEGSMAADTWVSEGTAAEAVKKPERSMAAGTWVSEGMAAEAVKRAEGTATEEAVSANGYDGEMRQDVPAWIAALDGVKLPAEVPGTVYGTLLALQKMPDPFYRDNELAALALMERSFSYQTRFFLTEELLAAAALLLRFDGIDTLADIYINGARLGSTNNMHRYWEYDLIAWNAATEGGLRLGENVLTVLLHSPTRFIREANKAIFTGGSHEAMKGFPQLRKAHCMFGWDWGPRLPDAGLFRGVSLLVVEQARLAAVKIRQTHIKEAETEAVSEVLLEITAEVEKVREQQTVAIGAKAIPAGYEHAEAIPAVGERAETILAGRERAETITAGRGRAEAIPAVGKRAETITAGRDGRTDESLDCGSAISHTAAALALQVAVTAPDGTVYTPSADGLVHIRQPRLWWPNGYGEQPLYTVRAALVSTPYGAGMGVGAQPQNSKAENADAQPNTVLTEAVVLDCIEKRIGLRTLTVTTEPDEWGARFAHVVNGLPIFAMGADYIPEDNLLSRVTRERTERLLSDCVAAHYNCIRV